MGPSESINRALFLSTPSARRATSYLKEKARTEGYFYPRPPRGGRLGAIMQGVYNHIISIHALREEGDSIWNTQTASHCQFLSTPSARRATHSFVSQSTL